MTETVTAPVLATKIPSMWQVVLHNDDYTPMDFVVHMLKTVFRKTDEEAYHLMLVVHHKGKGVAGMYTKEVALTKTRMAMDMASQYGHPLLVTAEEP